MPIEIQTLALGVFQTNCYIIGNTDTRAAVIIDPADEAGVILKSVRERGWTVKQILATHAHFDHVLAAGELHAATGAPFRLHKADLPLLEAMQVIGTFFGLELPPPPTPDGYVEEGERIAVDGIALGVLLTPGHSPGHVSFVLREPEFVFCGDCLFEGSIGRADLPGGDNNLLMRSIFEKLVPLGDGYTVASGHGGLTTIGQERRGNPFLLGYGGA